MRSPFVVLAADVVGLREGPSGTEILLVRRRGEPFQGMWALPGGHVEAEERTFEAARRELLEETGIQVGALRSVGAWGEPGRDPRGRAVSFVYLAEITAEARPRAGDDAAEARFVPLAELPALAFDHGEIVAAALALRKAGASGAPR